jgi:serine/threonine-protein kinase
VRLEPDWARLPATVPPRIASVLRACLQKNVKQRVAHMQDVRLALDGAFETAGSQHADAQIARATPRPLRRRALPVVATALVVAVTAAGAVRMLTPEEPRVVTRSVHILPAGRLFFNPFGNVVAIAADGRHFLYNGSTGVVVRALDSLSERVIPGTEGSGTTSPFFSPDGQTVGFFDMSARRLRRISANGGSSVQLTMTSTTGPDYGVSWERDGSILYGQLDGIWQVSEDGGAPRRVIQTEQGEQASAPRRLPGGDWVLFALTRGTGGARWDGADIVVQSLASGERRVLLKGRGSDARYVPTGHLVYAQGADLHAVAFDVDTLKVTGGPVPVVRGVRRAINPTGSAGSAYYDISTSGTLVYVPGSATGNALSTLAWVDSQGRREAIGLPAGQYAHPRFSPDGKWLAVERQANASIEIWLYELSGTTAERRLSEGGNNRYPVWSRDGASLVFQSDREGDRGIFRQRADGAGVAERLTTPAKGTEHIPEDWSPAEDRLAFSAVSGTTVELWMWTPSDRIATRFGTVQSASPFQAAFSPDGKWLAYTHRGPDGVLTYAQSLTSSSRYQIGRTEDVVHHPLWSPDGKRLIYFPGGNSSAVAVDIRTEPTFAVGRPTPLPGNGLPLNVMPASLLNHDVGRDGRFVTILDGGEAAGAVAASNQIVIVQNWFEELKRLVPTR